MDEEDLRRRITLIADRCGVSEEGADPPNRSMAERLASVEVEVGLTSNKAETAATQPVLSLGQLITRQSEWIQQQSENLRHVNHSTHIRVPHAQKKAEDDTHAKGSVLAADAKTMLDRLSAAEQSLVRQNELTRYLNHSLHLKAVNAMA